MDFVAIKLAFKVIRKGYSDRGWLYIFIFYDMRTVACLIEERLMSFQRRSRRQAIARSEFSLKHRLEG